MTDNEIDELAKAIADLKRATKRNDPFLRSLFDDKGWLGLGLAGSIGITLFCLPAHFLTAAYGSFAAIPALLQALLWAVLGGVLVIGGVQKSRLLLRKARARDEDDERRTEGPAALTRVMKAVFGGWGFHMAVPLVIGGIGVAGFAFTAGHPWYGIPGLAILLCFWANFMGLVVEHREYLVMGWWCLLTGLAGLFFIEKAPFIWTFIIYGGVLWCFTGVLLLESKGRRDAGHDQGR